MDNSLAKELFFRRYMMEGQMLFVAVNTTKIGVILPDFLYEQSHCLLNFGYNLAIPITDLEVTRDGVRATMSFNRTPFKVSLPWYSIFLIQVEGDYFACPIDAPLGAPELPGPQGPTGPTGPLGPTGGPCKSKRSLPSGWGVFPGGKGAA